MSKSKTDLEHVLIFIVSILIFMSGFALAGGFDHRTAKTCVDVTDPAEVSKILIEQEGCDIISIAKGDYYNENEGKLNCIYSECVKPGYCKTKSKFLE